MFAALMSGPTTPVECSLNTSVGANTVVTTRLNEEMSRIEDVAEGSFGVVMHGILDMDRRKYAVKQSKKPIAGEGDLQQRLQEIFALSALQHPHILRYYDGWVEERTVYLRTEWLPLTVGPAPLEEAEVATLLRHIGAALHHLHSRDMVHRDVKPENILCTRAAPATDGAPGGGAVSYKLCDFGLARPVPPLPAFDTGEQFRGLNDDDGDRVYLSPEALAVCRSRAAGFEIDIYALGATCLRLMGIADPAQMLQRRRRHTPAAPPPEWERSYSRPLRELVLQMVHEDPAQRPTAFQVARAFTPKNVLEAGAVRQRRAVVDRLVEEIEQLKRAQAAY